MEIHPVIFVAVAVLCAVAFWPQIKKFLAGPTTAAAVASVEGAFQAPAASAAPAPNPEAAFHALLLVNKQLTANGVDAAKIATLTDPIAALIMHIPPASTK